MAISNGRLEYDTSTQVKYIPYKGNTKTPSPGGLAPPTYFIPTSGFTSTITSCYLNGTPGQTLSNSTLYYAYLWVESGGNTVIDWSTTGHATNTSNGVEQMIGDDTHTLIGMIWVNASGNIVNTTTTHTVASWDNRLPTATKNLFTANRTITATSPTEFNSEIQTTFLSWGDAVFLSYTGEATKSAAVGGNIYLYVDAASVSIATAIYFGTTNQQYNASVSGVYQPSEGMHVASLYGANFSGSSNFVMQTQSLLSVLSFQ